MTCAQSVQVIVYVQPSLAGEKTTGIDGGIMPATIPYPPLTAGDNQRPERTGAVYKNLRLSLQSPEKSWPGGRRRNQFWRGHGSPSVLNEVFSNLARLCASKSANGPRRNSFRPDSPLTTTSKPGTEDSDKQFHHTAPVRSGRVPHSIKNSLHFL